MTRVDTVVNCEYVCTTRDTRGLELHSSPPSHHRTIVLPYGPVFQPTVLPTSVDPGPRPGIQHRTVNDTMSRERLDCSLRRSERAQWVQAARPTRAQGTQFFSDHGGSRQSGRTRMGEVCIGNRAELHPRLRGDGVPLAMHRMLGTEEKDNEGSRRSSVRAA